MPHVVTGKRVTVHLDCNHNLISILAFYYYYYLLLLLITLLLLLLLLLAFYQSATGTSND